MLKTLEFRRQILHILFGIIIIALLRQEILTTEILLILTLTGIPLIFICKKNYRIPIIHHFLQFFEREKHLKKFPGRGIFFYLIGSLIVTSLFSREIAIAGIAILAFGDATTNIIGSNFGKVRIFFKPKKSIEGLLSGICMGMLGAYFFTNIQPLALLVASSLAMLAEIPHLKFKEIPIDDNLIIPLVASTTLYLISFL